MLTYFRLLVTFVLPVFFFDSCVNKDPRFYLDDKASLIAPWATAPLSFNYRDKAKGKPVSFQLKDVKDFRMNEVVFTGSSEDKFFVVQRSDGKNFFYKSIEERDSALVSVFSTSIEQLSVKPWYSSIRGNVFFPYTLAYYSICFILITIYSFNNYRNKTKKRTRCCWQSAKPSAA